MWVQVSLGTPFIWPCATSQQKARKLLLENVVSAAGVWSLRRLSLKTGPRYVALPTFHSRVPFYFTKKESCFSSFWSANSFGASQDLLASAIRKQPWSIECRDDVIRCLSVSLVGYVYNMMRTPNFGRKTLRRHSLPREMCHQMIGRFADCLQTIAFSITNVGMFYKFLSVADWFLWQPAVIEKGIRLNVLERGVLDDAIKEFSVMKEEGRLL